LKYRVEKVDALNKRDVILQLWARNFSLTNAEERFAWMYEENPERVPDVWFLLDQNGRCVGMVAVSKRKFFYDGKVLNAGQAMDFIVNKEHRALGPALQLQRCIIEEMDNCGLDFLYSFPNKKSKAVAKRAGFKDLGFFCRWTLVLRSSYLIKKYIDNKFLSAIAGGALDVVLRAKRKAFFRRIPDFESSFPVLCETDNVFDELWQGVDSSFKIVGDRQSAFIQWRFAEYPESDYQCFLVKSQTRPHGYIIFKTCEKYVSIVDFLADKLENLKYLFQLFTDAIDKKKYLSISVDCIGYALGEEFFKSIGFVKRPTNDCVFVSSIDALKDKNILIPESWYLTVADRDV